MRVLVTGGTGFVGSWSAKAIADAGHDVRFFVRDPARLETSAAAIGVDTRDYAIGDITDRESVAAALDGCDGVLHAAALVAMDASEAAAMSATNIEGARNVLGLAAKAGLDPIVHVSSFSALFRPGLEMLHADLPVVGGKDAYGQSKAQVDLYARGMQDGGAPVIITYPGMVMGPPAGNQFGEPAEGVQAAIEMGLLPGRSAAWTIVDVRDLAKVHAALFDGEPHAPRYMAAGARLPIQEIASLLSDVSDKDLRVLPVPDSALRVLGQLVDRFDTYLPFDTPISEAAMQYYTQMPPSDDSPSETDLGVTYRDPRETLAETVAGLRRVGRLP